MTSSFSAAKIAAASFPADPFKGLNLVRCGFV